MANREVLELIVRQYSMVIHRLNTEKMLEESQQHFKDLVETSEDFVIYRLVKDKDAGPFHQRVVIVNPSICDIAGIPDKDMYNVPMWFQHIHPDDLERLMKANKLGFLPPYRMNEEFRINHPEKGMRWLHVRAKGMPDETGELRYANGIVIDITSRKKLELEREEMSRRLVAAQKLESLGQLAGGVAHDLNNMLTPILGYSEVAMLDHPENDHLRDEFSRIYHSAKRAKELTWKLLAYGRKQILKTSRLHLNEVVNEFLPILRSILTERVNVEIRLTDEACFVDVDQHQIEQVMMNLAINAGAAMPSGGRLLISTGISSVNESNPIGDIEPNLYGFFSFSDTGSGMDKDIIDHIFEPFYSTKDEHEGTGLGLSTSYGIVRQHAGSLTVESEIGKGSIFTVYLPLKEGEKIPVRLEEKNSTNDMEKKERILLVEDDIDVGDMVQLLLERLGYNVHYEPDAVKATDMDTMEFDLLITDVIMPRMNGREVWKKIGRPDLKVLYLSGHSRNIITRHGVLDQEIHLLQKPFSLDELRQAVEEVLTI